MDPFKGNPSEFNRKPVQGRPPRQSVDDTEDENSYDLAAATVADGFRPSDSPLTDASSSSSTPNNPTVASPDSSQARLLTLEPSYQEPSTSAASKPPPARPSSAIKPPRPHDSLTLRNDGSNSLQTGPSLSSSAGMPEIPPQGPYQGPTSASHPYQMYLQRTLSDATASADQPASRNSYDGPRGPAHPYALYPQNIVTTSDETPHQIPVGFTTSGHGYQRQIGPDGEEAGALVGPLGHTEELPPYTRYPEHGMVSKTPAAVATAAVAEDGRAGTESPTTGTIAGAGGIGVATRNPEFSSTEEDLQPSQSRPSTHSRHDINTAAQSSAEKGPTTKWQQVAKRKLWGIVPYWAICMLFIGVLLIGIILGAVIGSVLSRHKSRPSGPPPGNYPSPTPTPAPDVVPLASVPISLPRLPVGNYAMPPLTTNQSPNACLSDHTQLAAWSCNLPSSYYQVNVDVSSTQKDTSCYNLSLKAINSVDAEFLWGTQPPNVYSKAMILVNDTQEPRRGPAWWLQVTYDKVVVVEEDDFPAKVKRWSDLDRATIADSDLIRTKSSTSVGAKDGDKPWICTWPDTTLEVFIYPIQNSTGPQPSPTTTASSAPNPYPTDGFHPYPKSMKFVERRVVEDAPKAYCRQVQVYNQGRSMKNLTDSLGNPIVVDIEEDLDPDSDSQKAAYPVKRDRRSVRRRWSEYGVTQQAIELTPCGCVWWSSAAAHP
ncbi:hypothetical protein MKX07_002555 [Trichoderma sp. CBMAI-0711]|uniref:DUF7820 domain-containing protein n=1 Tax=Trichoderma parareesei TaxID=858221 RepID=A0A2H2ZQ29_TRIPA|nr:hypothetical protein MKX07_002555 [Trichoderma sp. CBMAI-0711]OTA02825.1 hypothetical protein A9Z42_0032020 [Trichoderma parareesei]